MGDRLRAGKLSRYATSHPGQLSLAIPLWVGTVSTSLGWEGIRRSGVALAMRHRQYSLSTYGLNNLCQGMSTPPTLLCLTLFGWLHSTVCRMSVLTGNLSLWCTRFTAGQMTILCVDCPLLASQAGRLRLSSFWGR